MASVFPELPTQVPTSSRVSSLVITRNEFFAGVYFVACINGLLGRSIYTINLQGIQGAVLGFEMNAIVLFACVAGILLVLSSARDRVTTLDFLVAAACLLFVALPIFPLSWVAVAALSIYVLWSANDGDQRRRGALILLALTVPMLWSRLIFQFLANYILDADAIMVTALLGTERFGNLVRFADGSGYMMISPACTSFANVSFAFLCWVAVTQWAGHKWSAIDLLWSSLACASVIFVNVARIALTGVSRGHYEAIHNHFMEGVIGFFILCLTVAFSVFGARRELFARA